MWDGFLFFCVDDVFDELVLCCYYEYGGDYDGYQGCCYQQVLLWYLFVFYWQEVGQCEGDGVYLVMVGDDQGLYVVFLGIDEDDGFQCCKIGF